MFLSQDFMQLNLSSTTLNTKLHSLRKLNKLGIMLPPPSLLIYLKKAFIIWHKPPSSTTSKSKLIILKKFSNNTSLFLTFLHLGKTKSKKELNSTWLISLLPQLVNKQSWKSIKMLNLKVILLSVILLFRVLHNQHKHGLNLLKSKNQFNNLRLGLRPKKLEILRHQEKL